MSWKIDITNRIKLVIWDLDDTIWAGTLAEKDDIKLYNEIRDIILKLNQRGIMNSICSKNDYAEAKRKLEEYNMWDYFVFPSIDFLPKGQKIKDIISSMNLRDNNVLFIDDNMQELQEAKHFNPNINILHASFANNLLGSPFLIGKKDKELTRLKQYKLLEKQAEGRKMFSSNSEFIKSLHVKVRFISYSETLFERICEMIERTNQLNFTKNRMTRKELLVLLQDKEVTCKCIQVIYDLGDMGIVGFYAVKENKLIHFLFSCRIINMDVEQWVYERIGYPKLDIVEPVAGMISKKVKQVDYIQSIEDDLSESNEQRCMNNYLVDSQMTSIFALGACDMGNMIGNLATPCNKIVFECNTFKGNARCVNVGTEYIRSSFDMNEEEMLFCKKYFYNYTGSSVFNTKLFSSSYDFVILSFLDDYQFNIWELKEDRQLRVLRFDEPVLDTNGNILGKEQGNKWMEEKFEEPHLITKDRFYDNLSYIRDKLDSDCVMVLINGPELDYYSDYTPHNAIVNSQIILLNKELHKFSVEHSKNVALVDVNRFIKERSDFSDFIFHWSVISCHNIAKECLKKMSQFRLRKHDYLKKLPIQGRKIILLGLSDYAVFCYYSLLMNGIDIEAVCYDQIVTECELYISSMSMLVGKKNDYYLLIADEEGFSRLEPKLNNMEYNPYEDYICLNPIPFIRHFSTVL